MQSEYCQTANLREIGHAPPLTRFSFRRTRLPCFEKGKITVEEAAVKLGNLGFGFGSFHLLPRSPIQSWTRRWVGVTWQIPVRGARLWRPRVAAGRAAGESYGGGGGGTWQTAALTA